MTQARESTSVSDFAAEIAELAGQSDAPTDAGFMEVLRGFVAGLEKAGIGASLRRAGDGVRHNLVLWPKYRPGWRTLMLTFRVDAISVVVTGSSSRAFDTPRDLRDHLLDFARSRDFKATLALLREQAQEPVEARLEASADDWLLVEVSAAFQERLHEQRDQTLELAVELEPGERVPDADSLRWLRSAGVDVPVRSARIKGRTVALVVGGEADDDEAILPSS